jgi:hypothetical protein
VLFYVVYIKTTWALYIFKVLDNVSHAVLAPFCLKSPPQHRKVLRNPAKRVPQPAEAQVAPRCTLAVSSMLILYGLFQAWTCGTSLTFVILA